MRYLVGTPKGRLTPVEKHLLDQPWQEARKGVQVKLLAQDGELYVFAQSADRVLKERAMRPKWLWQRLNRLAAMQITREQLLMKLGAARAKAPIGWRLIDITVDSASASLPSRSTEPAAPDPAPRRARRLRTNLTRRRPRDLSGNTTSSLSPSKKPSKTSKGTSPSDRSSITRNVGSRPISSSPSWPIVRTSHCSAACMRWPGLSARSAIEKFAAVQMIDVHVPTTDGRASADALHPARTRTPTPDQPAQAPTTTPSRRRKSPLPTSPRQPLP